MNSVTYDTTVSIFGNNTGIEIPNHVLEKLAAGKRPSLMVTVNGYEFQCTPGVMNGKTMISFSSEHRNKSGLTGGDQIHVKLTVATEPPTVEISEDFLKALQATNTEKFFKSLSNSLQRYHCDLINSAAAAETKQRRIQKAVDLFKQGKKR